MQVISRYAESPQATGSQKHINSQGQRGFALIALLVAINVMSIWVIAAVPLWVNQVQREQERELIYRGKAIAKAILAYREDFPAEVLSDLEPLVEHRYLRPSCLRDPINPDGDWRLLLSSADLNTLISAIQLGQIDQLLMDESDGFSGAALVGVASLSPVKAILSFNPMQDLGPGAEGGGTNPFAQMAENDPFAEIDRDQDEDGEEEQKILDASLVRNWYFLAGLDLGQQMGGTGVMQPAGQAPAPGATLQNIFGRQTGRQQPTATGQNPFANKRPNKKDNNPF